MKVSVSNTTEFTRNLDLDGDPTNDSTTVPIGPKARRVKVEISSAKILSKLEKQYAGVLTFRRS